MSPILNIFTSIAPFQIEKQAAAIASWSDLSASIHSVNNADEIAKLSPRFPQVKFHECSRDGRSMFGKPYVFIDDIFETAQKVLGAADIFVLCNSDIFLDPRFYRAEDFTVRSKEMTLATRFNVPSRESPVGVDYDCGIDVFCARCSGLRELRMGDFCLGVPFWDFWLPMLAIHRGFSIRKLDYPLAVHVNHPENYSHANLQKSCIAFVKGLTECRADFNALLDRIEATHGTSQFDEVMMNEVIHPTIATLRRACRRRSWSGAALEREAEVALKHFTELKHSDTFAVRFFENLLDTAIAIRDDKAVSQLSSSLAHDASRLGYYPLYSGFFARFPDAYGILPQPTRRSSLEKQLLPVIAAGRLFGQWMQ